MGDSAAFVGALARGRCAHLVCDPVNGPELRALLQAHGCRCLEAPGELETPHEPHCPMWREPEPPPPEGGREWLVELLRWSVRTADYTRRAEQTLGNLCDAARLSMPDGLALFRDLRACERHLVCVPGCVPCLVNIDRRAAAYRALRTRR